MLGEAEQAATLAEDVAIEVERLARVFQALKDSSLKQRFLVTLIWEVTRIPKKHVKVLLDSLPDLHKHILKEPTDAQA